MDAETIQKAKIACMHLKSIFEEFRKDPQMVMHVMDLGIHDPVHKLPDEVIYALRDWIIKVETEQLDEMMGVE